MKGKGECIGGKGKRKEHNHDDVLEEVGGAGGERGRRGGRGREGGRTEGKEREGQWEG